MSFFGLFKSKSKIEKVLKQTNLLTSNFTLLSRNEIEILKKYLQEGEKPPIDDFFIHINKLKSLEWPVKIKILTTIHRMIIDVGEDFANGISENTLFSVQTISKEQMKKFSQQIFFNVNILQWIQDNIINIYYNYLQKLAANYQIYKICIEDAELPESEDFKLNYKMKFMWMFKIFNLQNFIGKIVRTIKIALEDFDKRQHLLIRDIGLLVFHDLVGFYDVLSSELQNMVGRYILLATCDAVQLFELLQMMDSCTQNLKEFVKIKDHIDPYNAIKNPNWFELNEEEFADFESHYKKIQVLQYNSNNMKKELNQLKNQRMNTDFPVMHPVHEVMDRSKTPQVETNKLHIKCKAKQSKSFIGKQSDFNGQQKAFTTEPDFQNIDTQYLQEKVSGNILIKEKLHPRIKNATEIQQQTHTMENEQQKQQQTGFRVISLTQPKKAQEVQENKPKSFLQISQEQQLQKMKQKEDKNLKKQKSQEEDSKRTPQQQQNSSGRCNDFSFDEKQNGQQQEDDEQEEKDNASKKSKKVEQNILQQTNEEQKEGDNNVNKEDYNKDYLITDKDDAIFNQKLEVQQLNQIIDNNKQAQQIQKQQDEDYEFRDDGSEISKSEIIKLPDEQQQKQEDEIIEEKTQKEEIYKNTDDQGTDTQIKKQECENTQQQSIEKEQEMTNSEQNEQHETSQDHNQDDKENDQSKDEEHTAEGGQGSIEKKKKKKKKKKKSKQAATTLSPTTTTTNNNNN